MGIAEHNGVRSNYSKSSGKWYFEITIDSGTTHFVGIGTASAGLNGSVGSDEYGYAYHDLDGKKYHNATPETFGNTYEAGDVIGVALDLDNNKLWFAKNGVWQGSGDPVAGTGEAYSIDSGAYYAMWSGYDEGQVTANFGNSAFSYTIPTGFTAYSEGFGPCFWDEDNAGAEVTVSDELLSATTTQPGSTGVNEVIGSSIGILGRSSGKYYFEVLLQLNTVVSESWPGSSYPQAQANPSIPGAIEVGIGTSGINVENQVSDSTYGYAIHPSISFGYTVGPGGLVFPARFAQVVVGVAVDLDTGDVWFSHDGVWSGSPASGTGARFSGLGTSLTFFPAGTAVARASTFYSGVYFTKEYIFSSLTLRTTSYELSYSPPTDFRPWADYAETSTADISEDTHLSDEITVNQEIGEVPATHEGTLTESFTTDDEMYGMLPGDTEDPDSGHIGESFTVDESIEAETPYKTLSEDVQLSDAFDLESPYRESSENVQLSDEFAVQMEEWQADISEDVGLSDSILSPIYGEDEEDVELSESIAVYKEKKAGPLYEHALLHEEVSAARFKGESIADFPHFFEAVRFGWRESVTSEVEFTDAVEIKIAWKVWDSFGIAETLSSIWAGSESVESELTVVDKLIWKWPQSVISEMDLSDTALPETTWELHDHLTYADTVGTVWIGSEVIGDALNIIGQSIIFQVFNETASSEIDVSDTLSYLHQMVQAVTDSMDITGTLAAQMTYNPSIVEAVAITGLVIALRTLNEAHTESLDLTDMSRWGWREAVADSIDVADAALIAWIAIQALTDSIEFTETALGSLVISDTITDTIEYAASVAIQQVLQLGIVDELSFSISVELDGELWECWVLNTNAFHASVYSGYDFNSYCVYNGVAYGCKSDGIYKLTGSTDNGSAFHSGVVFPETRFGSMRNKRFRRAYFGLSGTSPSLKVEDETYGSVTYSITNSHANINRTQKGKAWTLKLQDFDDVDFIELVPVYLTR